MSKQCSRLTNLVGVGVHILGVEGAEVVSQLVRRHLVVQPQVRHRDVPGHVGRVDKAQQRRLEIEQNITGS